MKQCIVKIAVSTTENYNHIDDVVYYRSGMSPDFVAKWMWFFEYIAAKVKVANPHRRVELWHGPADIMLGEEWHEHRRQAMLKSRNIKIKKLQRVVPNGDLFGFAQTDLEQNINDVKQQIIQLEKDEFPISEFPEYINKIKTYIKEL